MMPLVMMTDEAGALVNSWIRKPWWMKSKMSWTGVRMRRAAMTMKRMRTMKSHVSLSFPASCRLIPATTRADCQTSLHQSANSARTKVNPSRFPTMKMTMLLQLLQGHQAGLRIGPVDPRRSRWARRRGMMLARVKTQRSTRPTRKTRIAKSQIDPPISMTFLAGSDLKQLHLARVAGTMRLKVRQVYPLILARPACQTWTTKRSKPTLPRKKCLSSISSNQDNMIHL
jgi:hypothetical protein